MELICKVVVNLRTTPPVCHRKRITWGSILLGSTEGKVKNDILIVRTAQCTSGLKYPLRDNIHAIFDKFVSEGKATISFKEPPYEVLISSADVNCLKKFVLIVKVFAKSVKERQSLPSLVTLSQKSFTPPKTSIVVVDNDGYSTKILSEPKLYEYAVRISISNCVLKLASPRQLRKCEKLAVLNFTKNDLRCSSYLDVESKVLQSLNVVQCVNVLPPPNLFAADKIYYFAESLTELNLNGNRWNEVPMGIFQFRNLDRLNLNNNKLTHFPDRLTSYPKLQEFHVANNCLTYLPSSIGTLRLFMLDTSGNPFKEQEIPDRNDRLSENGKIQSLLELASRAILNAKLKFHLEEGMLPTALMQNLVNGKQCVCGNKFVEGKEYALFYINLLNITSSLTYVQLIKNAPVRGMFCTSLKSCYPISYTL